MALQVLDKKFHPDWASKRQPKSFVIDWSNPITKGLTIVDVGDGRRNLIGNRPVTVNGSVSSAIGGRGKEYVKGTAAANNLETPGFSGTIGPITALTLIARTQDITANAIAGVLRKSTSVGGFEWNLGNGFGAIGDYSKPRLAGSGTDIAMWINGERFTSANPVSVEVATGEYICTAITGDFTDVWTQHLRLGALSAEFKNVSMALFLQWDRILSDSEEISLFKDPYQVLAPVTALVYFTSAAVATAAITGTATAGIAEDDITAGGKTIIITLTGDTWVTAGATFDAQRQNIIDGLDSAQSELTGWNNEVRDNEVVTAVVRTSDTVVTITLTAQAGYDITAQETITVTVPNTALVTSTSNLAGSPTFTVSPITGTVVPVIINHLKNQGIL